MIRGFYTAASSLRSQQTSLNAIANNVANISTTGFKPQQTAFSSLLYESLNGGAGNKISTGHGVKVQQLGIDFTQGDLNPTGAPMDFAILGEGFFVIENPETGERSYTRDGNFKIGMEGKSPYLVNSAGNYVLGPKGDKIAIKERFETIDEKKVSTGEWDLDASKIGVVTFSNPYGLELAGGNQFISTPLSGEADFIKEAPVKMGCLENSSVQLSKEMVKMIEASKGFSFGSRIVQTADELEKTINQLR